MAKVDIWLDKDNLIRVQGWARDGLTDQQIAKKMGIGVRTLYEWKKKHSQFSQALKSGKEVVDYAVENALLKKALAGDVGACCFWLKNRRPDKWKDRIDAAVSMEDHKTDMLSDIRSEMARLKAGGVS